MLELLVYMIKTKQVDIYDSILLPATLDLRQPVSYFVKLACTTNLAQRQTQLPCVERATLPLPFFDTNSYLPYLCAKYPYIST